VTWNWLLKRVEATTVSYVAFVTPIIAVLLGVLVGDERFDLLVLVGAGITLSGIWLSTSKRIGVWMRAAMRPRAVNDGAADPDPPGERR